MINLRINWCSHSQYRPLSWFCSCLVQLSSLHLSCNIILHYTYTVICACVVFYDVYAPPLHCLQVLQLPLVIMHVGLWKPLAAVLRLFPWAIALLDGCDNFLHFFLSPECLECLRASFVSTWIIILVIIHRQAKWQDLYIDIDVWQEAPFEV